MKHLLLLTLTLTSCQPVVDTLGDVVCLWRDMGAVYEPSSDPEPGEGCLRVTAPEHARVSAVELDPCDAEDQGHATVLVPAGDPVYRYSEPDLTTEPYVASWEACP